WARTRAPAKRRGASCATCWRNNRDGEKSSDPICKNPGRRAIYSDESPNLPGVFESSGQAWGAVRILPLQLLIQQVAAILPCRLPDVARPCLRVWRRTSSRPRNRPSRSTPRFMLPTVFIVSDGTGITPETFAHSILPRLELKSSHAMGRGHQNADTEEYKTRIEAINFSLAHDDGQSNRNLSEADVILVGVSRSGKTPTSLYLAMQYGVKAANYPLIPEDFERGKLPSALTPHRDKLFGLSIDPQRLSEIRNERRPGSKYAAPENCRYEINEAEAMMRREGIKWLSSTHKSIEEIATTILQEIRLDRQSY